MFTGKYEMRACLAILTNYYGSRDTGSPHTNIASITRGGPMDRGGGADVSLATCKTVEQLPHSTPTRGPRRLAFQSHIPTPYESTTTKHLPSPLSNRCEPICPLLLLLLSLLPLLLPFPTSSSAALLSSMLLSIVIDSPNHLFVLSL